MNKPIFFALLILLVSCTTNEEKAESGHKFWRGIIHYSEAEIPFQFEIEPQIGSDSVHVTIINGSDRAEIRNATISNDSLIVPMFAFDITLKARINGNRMEGELVKHYSNISSRFTATAGEERFSMTGRAPASAVLDSSFDITIRHDRDNSYPGKALFIQNGNKVTGTIMTEVSDFRYFEGIISGDSLLMSSFDGVHAFLIRGIHTDEGWSGEVVFSDGYEEKWKESTKTNSNVGNSFDATDLRNERIKPVLNSLSLNGEPLSIDQYKGKVLLLQIFGTWCPNSWDQTKFLTDWYKENKKRGVEVLAVNYEANYSEDYGNSRINKYSSMMGISYPVVLGGRLNKSEAAETLPYTDRILAFPTLVLIDKEGYIHDVSGYFTGPATGTYYEAFKDRLNTSVDYLLAQ